MRTLTNGIIRIAVDASGGDEKNIPGNPINGAVMALDENPRIFVQLVGPENEILKVLGNRFDPTRMEIIHASEIIGMGDSVPIAREKRDSSIHLGLDLLRGGGTAAFVSAGNTAAVTAIACSKLRRIKGVKSPAIAAVLPTVTGSPCVFLDVGARLRCNAIHLFQFGVMGAVFCKSVLNISNPRVALLNVGTENSKGDETVSEARKLFENFGELNFCGFVEGDGIYRGDANVIVCEGFTGNTHLKKDESFLPTLSEMLRRIINKGPFTQKFLAGTAKWTFSPTIAALKRLLHYERYGGAPLLGLTSPVTIAHGKSSERAIANAIKQGFLAAEQDINDKIEKLIALSNETQ